MVCISHFIYIFGSVFLFFSNFFFFFLREEFKHRSTYTELKNVNAAVHLKGKTNSQQIYNNNKQKKKNKKKKLQRKGK